MTTTLERALDVNAAMLALGNEVFETEDATFVRNRETPNVWDSNHVTGVRASTVEAIERLLAQAEREYEGMDRLSFYVDHRTPPQFEARLVQDGFVRDEVLVMLLEDQLRSAPREHEIRAVKGEEDWQALDALHALDAAEYEAKKDEVETYPAREMARTRRLKSPPLRCWLACVDGEPQSYLLSWEGTDGVGQVEDLFTHPKFRHQGLATALIRHCVADCRAHGAGPVVIVADASDTPKEMYAAMGFRPVAVERTYRRKL
jgi:GNAT superfamily N-acetyltransferase